MRGTGRASAVLSPVEGEIDTFSRLFVWICFAEEEGYSSLYYSMVGMSALGSLLGGLFATCEDLGGNREYA